MSKYSGIHVIRPSEFRREERVPYSVCLKRGEWLSEIFGTTGVLIKKIPYKYIQFYCSFVLLEFDPSVDVEKFAKAVKAHNETMAKKHQRYLFGVENERESI